MNATQLCQIWVSLICKLQSKPFLWYGDLNLNQCQFDLSFLNLKTITKPFLWCGDLNQSFFVHNKSLNARWPTIWSWILSLYPLRNRLNIQDFTLSSSNLHWAFKLYKKWGWNQTAVKNHYSGIWQAETCIQSLLRHKYRFNTNFLKVCSNCKCMVFSAFSSFSLQSLKNQLSNKA